MCHPNPLCHHRFVPVPIMPGQCQLDTRGRAPLAGGTLFRASCEGLDPVCQLDTVNVSTGCLPWAPLLCLSWAREDKVVIIACPSWAREDIVAIIGRHTRVGLVQNGAPRKKMVPPFCAEAAASKSIWLSRSDRTASSAAHLDAAPWQYIAS